MSGSLLKGKKNDESPVGSVREYTRYGDWIFKSERTETTLSNPMSEITSHPYSLHFRS